MCLDDLLAYIEAEPHSVAVLLRREERLEDPVTYRFGDADPGVLDRHDGLVVAERRRYRESPAEIHRLRRVSDKVHPNLRELIRGAEHADSGEVRAHRDAMLEHVVHQGEDLRDVRVDVDDLAALGGLGHEVRPERAYHARGFLRRLADNLRHTPGDRRIASRGDDREIAGGPEKVDNLVQGLRETRVRKERRDRGRVLDALFPERAREIAHLGARGNRHGKRAVFPDAGGDDRAKERRLARVERLEKRELRGDL